MLINCVYLIIFEVKRFKVKSNVDLKFDEYIFIRSFMFNQQLQIVLNKNKIHFFNSDNSIIIYKKNFIIFYNIEKNIIKFLKTNKQSF